jgi:hypothetical protein
VDVLEDFSVQRQEVNHIDGVFEQNVVLQELIDLHLEIGRQCVEIGPFIQNPFKTISQFVDSLLVGKNLISLLAGNKVMDIGGNVVDPPNEDFPKNLVLLIGDVAVENERLWMAFPAHFDVKFQIVED